MTTNSTRTAPAGDRSAEEPPYKQIRADFAAESLVVYQAYDDPIADAALAAGRFVAPFSFQRMTWIKPSFLWMMERCGWAEKPGQARVLAVRITRRGWEQALSEAALSDPDPAVYPDPEAWRRAMKQARVRVQWDPERSLRGGKLAHRSIQVGLSGSISQEYAERWLVELQEITPLVKQIRQLLRAGEADVARRLLPRERPYPVPPEIAARLGMRP